jgi:hypothetical protein
MADVAQIIRLDGQGCELFNTPEKKQPMRRLQVLDRLCKGRSNMTKRQTNAKNVEIADFEDEFRRAKSGPVVATLFDLECRHVEFHD